MVWAKSGGGLGRKQGWSWVKNGSGFGQVSWEFWEHLQWKYWGSRDGFRMLGVSDF